MTLIEMLRANGSWEADAAVTEIRVRDMRIEKLEVALREIAADFGTVSAVGTMDALYSAAAILAERISIARNALEGKDD